MARLVSPPVGIRVTSIEPLSGPRTIGQANTQAISGYQQTSAAPFGLWRFRFGFAPMRDAGFRRFRGWITSLHGGANATRWYFFDPDMMLPAESGLGYPSWYRWGSVPGQDWANGQAWANGEDWAVSPPLVGVAAGASLGATQISLDDEFWGHQLQIGDYLGVAEEHFGMYTVTEVVEEGTYRIWPPLRKAVTTSDSATLRPVLALRLESEEAAAVGRGLVAADGLTATMVEVLDYDVRDYFAD